MGRIPLMYGYLLRHMIVTMWLSDYVKKPKYSRFLGFQVINMSDWSQEGVLDISYVEYREYLLIK